LWAQGNADAVIKQDQFFNELAKKGDIDIHCGCVGGANFSAQDAETVEKICAQHSAVTT